MSRTGLIGLVTCDRDASWLAACRDTWLRDVPPDFDVVIVDKSFMPKGMEDRVENLPAKTKELCAYTIENSYRWLLKVDNDCLCRPKLFRPPYGYDYAGRLRGRSSPEYVPEGVSNKCDYVSGGGYWLSARAMQVIAQSPLTKDIAEDRWVANTLHGFGIHAHGLPGFIAPTHVPVSNYYRDPGCVILMQMQEPDQMRRAYRGEFDPPPPPTGSRPEHYPMGHPLRAQMGKI